MRDSVFHILMALFSVEIVKVYLDNWRNDNRRGKKVFAHYLVWGMFFLLQLWIKQFGIRIPILALVIHTLIIFLLFKTKYDNDNKVLIFRSGIFVVIWMLAEVVAEYILEKTGVVEHNYWNMAGSAVSMTIMYILLQCLRYYKRNGFKSFFSYGHWFRFLFVPFTTVYIVHHLVFFNYFEQRDRFLMVTVIALIIVNVVIFDVYNELDKQMEMQKKNSVYEQEIALCNRQAAEREAAYEETRTIRHNLNGYLLDLRNELLSGRTDEALVKIEDILEYNQIYRNEVSHSGNLVIDSLINYKYSLALKDKIRMNCYIFVPDQLTIDGADLCIILNNILDNAIEAVRKLPEEQRNIDISVSIAKGNLSIMVKNPYVGDIKTDGSGNMITNKFNCRDHGIGLASVRRTVEKYNGEFLVDTEAGIFVVRILIYL